MSIHPKPSEASAFRSFSKNQARARALPPHASSLVIALFLCSSVFCSAVARPPAGLRSLGQGASQVYSEDPDALVSLARTRIAEDHANEARQLLLRALAQSPNSPEANLLLGNLLLSEHHYPEAMDRFETILAINLRSPEARQGELSAASLLALQARAAGHQDAALACLQHARESLPDDPALLTDLGIQAHDMHLLKPAAEALNSALALRPDDPTALYALARVEMDQAHLASAEQHFRIYLAARPGDASAHYGLGHLLQMQLRTDAASDEYRQSIALQPAQTESYYQLGQMALDAHQDAEARSSFEKTLARSAVHGGALTGMGILAYRARDYQSAARYLTSATAAAPEYQPAHYYLGLTLARLGEKAGSDRELKLAVDLAQKQQGKAEAVPSATLP